MSALQLLVPGAEALLDAVRGVDGAALLAPAHVSLGYPWLPSAEALAALDDVRAAAARVPAFDAELLGPHAFAADPRGRVLVHVRLADEGPVRALAALLGADLRQVHLSVARVLPGGDVAQVRARLAPLLPRSVRVDELDVTVQRAGRWTPALRVPLGVAGR